MTFKSILAALGVAALVAATVPVAAQAEGMHRNMKRQMMMSHRMHMMHHRHPMMMMHHHRHMMRTM